MVRRTVRLVTLLGTEVAAVVVLHRLASVDGLGGPGGDPRGWLRSATPEEVVAGTIRGVALACAWWLLASTLLYLVVRLTRWREATPSLGRIVPPVIRRQIDRALAVSMLASAALGGVPGVAVAGDPPPATIAVRDGRAIESFPSPATPASVPAAAPAAPPEPVAEPAPAGHHVVVTGDSLWTIASTHAGSADVAGYWVRVVDTNRPALRSGNPDLVYPGEIVDLP